MRSVKLVLAGFAIGVLVAMPFRWRSGSMPQLAPDASSAAERELERIIPKVDIEAMPFERAVAEIQKLTPTEITVDWGALTTAGVDRTTSVSIHGTGMRLWQVLDELTLIETPSLTFAPVSFTPIYGRIAIGKADQNIIGWVYDVNDLLIDAPPTESENIAPAAPPTREEKSKTLMNFITHSVAPGSWRDEGGIIGEIRQAAGCFYVSNDWLTHRKIQLLLSDLRSRQAPPPPIIEKAWSNANSTFVFPELPGNLETLLRTPLEQVELNGVPFDDAIDILQKSSGIGVSVNWKALADAGVARQSPVFLHTRSVPLSSVLDALFADPIHGVVLGFTLEDGIIKISTRVETTKTTITRIYDVRDFIAQAQPPERQQAIYNIAKFIIDTVDPDSWRDNNGSVGTIGVILPTRGRLVVTQSWSNHERIAASLLTLRKNGCGLAFRYHESDPLE